ARPPAFCLRDEAERIADALICPGRAGARGSLRGAVFRGLVDADRPGRAVTGDGFLLVARNFAVGEAGEVVVALVVFLDVREAEHEILTFGIAPDGCAMHCILLAAVPLTRRRGAFRTLHAPLRANAVEIFGIEFHVAHYGV